jgi:hypothetical protein
MLLYILLGIIAVGVLLTSDSGKALLVYILCIGALGLIGYVGFYVVVFIFAGLQSANHTSPSQYASVVSEWDWSGILVGVLFVSATVYRALYPLGRDKRRQLWTGKLKTDEKKESLADN